ncbi:MAG: pseudaminic acid biosynthesis-associated protein PseG [Cyanobacteria bacterium RYN_339]|nr:pseudaminic acid biosynthesis-associated protein PseG [Cyanobacteria bacterium RYN_339]
MPADAPVLLIRVDASATIGLGHETRCRALAAAWAAAGGRVEVVTVGADLLARWDGAGTLMPAPAGSSADAAFTAAAARAAGAAWVVVDGYHFDATYRVALKADGPPLLVIDDEGRGGPYVADLILNQNPGAEVGWYADRPAGCGLLLGLDYALLRPEFVRTATKRPAPAHASKLLVSMGGADPHDLTGRVLAALPADPELEVRVAVGAVNPRFEALAALAARCAPRVTLEHPARDMVGLMAWADLAVVAAGSTCWELAAVGVPFAYAVAADNQRGIADFLVHQDAAVSLGWHVDATSAAIAPVLAALLADAPRRAELAGRLAHLVDGRGAARVAEAMRDPLALRPATTADARLLWGWANEPAVRANSFSSEPIPWEDHLAWLERRLADPASLLFVAQGANARPLGMVRFALGPEGRAEIGVSLEPGARGRGLGRRLILAGTAHLFATTGARQVDAYVKLANVGSREAFLRAGFEMCGTIAYAGHEAYHLVRRREESGA